MMKKISPRVLKVINILSLLWGCAVIWMINMHHSLMIGFEADPFSRGDIYGYFLWQPQIKAIYGIIFLLLIGKEFFLIKPVESKVKINFIISIVLPILFATQIIGWNYYLTALGMN